jgi:hypothetical protein
VARDALGERPSGGGAARLHVLPTNAMHEGEHHGDVVTYLRLHRIAPPSSRPSGR